MTAASEQATTPERKRTSEGAIAQLGERLPCTQEVVGSIPSGSTNFASALLQQKQVLVESYDGSSLLFNNLDLSF